MFDRYRFQCFQRVFITKQSPYRCFLIILTLLDIIRLAKPILKSVFTMEYLKPVAIVSPMRNTKKVKKFKNILRRKSRIYCNSPAIMENKLDKNSRLCSMFDNLKISSGGLDTLDIVPERAFEVIPDHDRKILDRMAAKLKRQITDLENAYKARQIWDDEKEMREKLQKQQEAEYKKYIRERRKAEQEINIRRIMENKQIDEWEMDHMKTRINLKSIKAEDRIKMIKHQQLNEMKRRHEIAKVKAENALDTLKENKLEEVIWRRCLSDNLKRKFKNAIMNKEVITKLTKQRRIMDNKIHEEIQRENWELQKSIESEQLERLKAYLEEKDSKIEQLKLERDDYIRKSRRLASSTAKMRENIRRSLSPDTFHKAAIQTQSGFRATPQYCLTPNSFESHIRLG